MQKKKKDFEFHLSVAHKLMLTTVTDLELLTKFLNFSKSH